MDLKKKIIGNRFVFKTALYLLRAKNRKSRIANMVMFHFGRCGSTVLARTLEQNSNIVWGHEILQNIPYNQHLIHKEKDRVKEIESFIQARMYRKNADFMVLTQRQCKNSI